MKNIQFLAIMATIFFWTAANYAQKAVSKDETAIRANVKQMQKGWNMKSGAEFAKPFSEDSDYVIINGWHLKGRKQNAENHQMIFDTIYKETTLSLAIEQIRFLRPDVAVVHVHGALSLKTKILNARITMIMTKSDGRWEIAAFQNTEIQAQK